MRRTRPRFRWNVEPRRPGAARGAPRRIAEARATIEARAKERDAREMAEHEAKMAAREAKIAATGKKPGGKPPQPPLEGPRPSDQVNLTDEESRIMPVAGGGFEQCYNAQAAVAAGSLLVVATDVVQAPNDKCQVEPTLEKIAALPEELGEVENLLADTGYFSADNVKACEKAGVVPVIAMGRQPHYLPLSERCCAGRLRAPKEPTPVEAMAHRLKTCRGPRLYALRKQTLNPCSESSSRCSDSGNFHCAGSIKFAGEWSPVTMARNLKPMFVPRPRLTRAGQPRSAMDSQIEACSRDPAGARLNPSPKGAGTAHSPRYPKCGTTQSDRLLGTLCPDRSAPTKRFS